MVPDHSFAQCPGFHGSYMPGATEAEQHLFQQKWWWLSCLSQCSAGGYVNFSQYHCFHFLSRFHKSHMMMQQTILLSNLFINKAIIIIIILLTFMRAFIPLQAVFDIIIKFTVK